MVRAICRAWTAARNQPKIPHLYAGRNGRVQQAQTVVNLGDRSTVERGLRLVVLRSDRDALG